MNDTQKILLIAQDTDVVFWVKSIVGREEIAWHFDVVEPLRITTPEINFNKYNLIILVWDKDIEYINSMWKNEPNTENNDVIRYIGIKAPSLRSSEGVLANLEDYLSEELFSNKVVVLARQITRDIATLLAEYNINVVLSLPFKQTEWDNNSGQIINKIKNFLENQNNRIKSNREIVISQFKIALNTWFQITDEEKMNISDLLLKELGNSAKYFELMSNKSLVERDITSAEIWLKKAINKNPNYLRSFEKLAELYYNQDKIAEALAIYEKLKLNSPFNIKHLTNLGKCYMQCGKYGIAEKILENTLQIDQYAKLAKETLGRVKCVLGDYDSAKDLLKNTTDTYDLAKFINKIGIKFVEEKNFDKAIIHYKKALEIIPCSEQNHLLLFNMALAFYKKGKSNNALSFTRLALVKKPDYEKAQKLLKILGC